MVTLPIHPVFLDVTEDDRKDDRKDNRKDDRKEIVSLSRRQEEILSLIEINDRITTEAIKAHFNLSMPTINRDIAFLKRNGVLLRIGGKKSGSWLIAKKVK